jgi:hypothetical protein
MSNVQRIFFDTLGAKLHIKSPQDWFRIPVRTALKEQGSSFIVTKHKGSLINGNNYGSLKHLFYVYFRIRLILDQRHEIYSYPIQNY